MRRLHLTALLVILLAPVARAENLVSPFAGSEPVGEYESDYAELPILEDQGEVLGKKLLEGRLHSRILRYPEQKSALEVYRSYERELEAGGFDILLAVPRGERRVQETLFRILKLENKFADRPYRGAKTSDLGYASGFVDWYLLARKNVDDRTAYVSVMISTERNLYTIDELRTEEMETGTVTLNVEALRAGLERDGKVAIYDIHFDTNSATIRAESKEALAIVAAVLKEHGDRRFYVVGHTDDTGSLDHNLSLSKQRADAVVEALARDHGIDAGRLTARGVGPLAPVGSNASESDRALNRRVELVVRL